MMEQQSGSVVVRSSCTWCSETFTGSVEGAAEFTLDHYDYAGHNLDWEVQTPDDPLTEHPEITRDWLVTCEKCHGEWRFSTEEDANHFHEEHASFMKHSEDLLTTQHEPETLSADDVEHVVSRAEDQGEVSGVHYVSVFQILREHGNHAAKIVENIQECLVDGTLYEIRENVLCVA